MDLSLFDDVLLDGLDFCAKVYALFEEIRTSESGTTRLRLRPTLLEKRLLEELLPICTYIQESYRPGRYMSVLWKSGNQSYDAELVQHGAYVSEGFYPPLGYIEVTCTMHKNEYLIREILESKGGGFGLEGMRRLKSGEIESIPISYSNKEFIDSYAKIVEEQIQKKAAKLYPENTTLIVQCSLNMPYQSDEWEILMTRVVSELPKSNFREIFFYDTVSHFKRHVYPARCQEAEQLNEE